MTGLDTNVLLRFFLQDDVLQSPRADAVMNSLTIEQPGWVGLAALLEFVWVLNSKERIGRTTISTILDRLLLLPAVIVEQADVLAVAVRQYRSTRADFADCLIAASAHAAGCGKTVTFDRIAARDAGMELLA